VGTLPAGSGTSTIYRARLVLALRPFRRLWFVTGLCSSADWLTVLALSGLASTTASTVTGSNFAFSGVLFANLLPGLLFAPIGGLLADRFDRRKVMAIADVVRFGVLLSIPFADTYWWIFAGTFLIQVATIMWIPCKDAALPNLLRRSDQVESATQLGLVMTYGLSVAVGGGLYVLITGSGTTVHVPPNFLGVNGLIKLAIVIAACFYLASAVTIATRLPELSLRMSGGKTRTPDGTPETRGMVRAGLSYIRRTPLVRGLLLGMMGAFAAGGAVVGAAQPYAKSLHGGQAAFGLLLISIFAGLIIGMIGAPKLARRVPHERLFGMAIIVAGLALVPMALSPGLALSLISVVLVGASAGAAFLTGVTIIGSKVEDAMRGRVNAVYQSMLKVVLGLSVAVSPLLVTVVRTRTLSVWGSSIVVDGTRPVILGGGLVAALVGALAYRQMDPRRTGALIAGLRAAVRSRPRQGNGLLITVEGVTAADTAGQAARLAQRLGEGERAVVLAKDPSVDDERLVALISLASLRGDRALALAAAAVRADIVERHVQPALDAGSIVVMERFADPHLSGVTDVGAAELHGLSDWATSRLRPDLVVLLDMAPDASVTAAADWQVDELLSEIATVTPDRYLVVDADGTDDEVGDRVTLTVETALRALPPRVEAEAVPAD
jgi:dTMP kinase